VLPVTRRIGVAKRPDLADARCMTNVNDDWYVAQAKPNAWKIAMRNLNQQGVATFMPLLEVTGHWRGKFLLERKPLFGGYLFLQSDPDSIPWRTINSTYGIGRLIVMGGTTKPRAVPPALIAELRKHCDNEGVYRGAPPFKAGDKVEIVQGPFTSMLATIAHLPSKERVFVLLDIMGRETQVELRPSQLSRTSAERG
jgi:transcriptional antiterminator RfaH